MSHHFTVSFSLAGYRCVPRSQLILLSTMLHLVDVMGKTNPQAVINQNYHFTEHRESNHRKYFTEKVNAHSFSLLHSVGMG